MELFLNDKLGKITIESNEVENASAILIMAHGAGAGMHHPFMTILAKDIAAHSILTVRFNFPYMEQGRKSPGSPKSNIECWKLVIEHIKKMHTGIPVFISGKSYGGRMASHLIAEDLSVLVKGIIYFGFPLHAPGRDSKDRASHLPEITVPQLFLQGSNDKLANIEMMHHVVKGLDKVEMKVIEGADHSFNVPKKSGKTKNEVMQFLSETSVQWIKSKLG